MRVLFLTLGSPCPPDSGVRIRDYNIIRNVARAHRVDLRCLLYSEEEIPALAEASAFCHSVDYVIMRPRTVREYLSLLPRHMWHMPPATWSFFYEEMAGKLRQTIDGQAIDLIQIEHSFLAPYLASVPRNSGCKTVLSLHNLGSRQYARMRHLRMPMPEKVLFWLKWLAMLGWETRAASRFDHVVAVSEIEAGLLREANPDIPVTLIENGCDMNLFTPRPETAGDPVMLFAGTLGYPPNVDAVLSFCQDSLPLIRREIPGARFVVVGHRPPPDIQRLPGQHGVEIMGSVPDVAPFYEQAHVCVVPLRAGGGTRLKIIEAMAAGRAVVSTTIGCEGLDVRHNEHLLIADDPADFAAAAIRLLRDADLRRRLTGNARQLVALRYDWAAITARLLRVYDEVTG
ncbi:MAG: glycosyltransferase family 4 protein [Blastocatellia bacterium]